MKAIKIFGKDIIEESAITQLENCLLEDSIGVLTADAHKGYSMPIGGAIAYKDHISPTGVGFDIACGNLAVRTNVKVSDLDIPRVMDEIFRRVSFGVGRHNNEKIDDAVFDKIRNADFHPQRQLLQLAIAQLGTVGSGNHYVNLFRDNEDTVWIGVHFGSRGFGHKTACGFIAMSQGLTFNDKGKEGSMDSKPILLDVNTEIGQQYISAMQLASDYAYAGRNMVVNKVLEIIGATHDINIHANHNLAWKENHFGQDYWVVRKGCTPAFPDQFGFIGANMLDASVIVQGVDSEESRQGLYSTVHGAGRVMSRTEAAGKKKWVKNEQGIKRPVVVGKGKVDFDAVRARMRENKVELRGAGADEAPEVYKNLKDVLAYQGNTIKVIHTLYPIGVCMAGDEYDPYKD